MPCVINEDHNDLNTNESCARGKGIKKAYYAKRSDIDWEAMAADAAQFDQDTCTISGFTMLGGATFNTLNFAKKSGYYDFTYTSDNGFYELLIKMIFEGKSAVNAKEICKLIQDCNYVMVIIDNNCEGRVVGQEFTDGIFDSPLSELEIGTHLDSSGQFGGDKPRDEIDWIGETTCAPLFHDISQADFENTYL